MTKSQLHTYFKIALDKYSNSIGFGGCPAFLDSEIDYWLDLGYTEEINNKFTGTNAIKQPFEKSVKRIHDLEGLVQTDTNRIMQNDDFSNVCTLKDAFKNKLFFVDAVFKFDNNKASVILISHDEAKKYQKSYNNIPWIETPVAVIEDGDLKIYYDPVSMQASSYKVDLTCVVRPMSISSLMNDQELTEIPEYMQHEVINRAVVLALENIESPRLETKSQLIQADE